MAIEPDLYTYLAADATLSGLVSTRIYPVTLPQGTTMPAVAYTRIASPVLDHNHGAAGCLVRARIQFDCWADTPAAAEAVAAAVKGRIDGFSGTMGSTTVGVCLKETELDDYDFDLKDFRRIVDFTVVYTES